MTVVIESSVKKQVFKQWISGDSRDEIATDNRIGAGTVTNIVNEWRKRLDDVEFDEMRDSMVFLKKQGISLSEVTTRARLYDYIKKLGAGDHQIESLIANMLERANSLPLEKIVDLVNQLYEISKS